MDTNARAALPGDKKTHPFLTLCFSMLATGIAAELIYTTSGRFSATGNRILQVIPLGIVLYGVLEQFFLQFCRDRRRWTPVVMLAGSSGMLAIQATPFSSLMAPVFGTIIGLFICASLVSFLESGDVKNRGLKVGFSASLYSVAIYPFRMSRHLLSEVFPRASIVTAGFLILLALLFLIFWLWPKKAEGREEAGRIESELFNLRNMIVILTVLIVLILLGQLMNAGTLENQGGAAGIPALYLIGIILRVPLGALLGYLVDRRLNILYLTIPIILLVLGCFIPLFYYGQFAGDPMAYLLLNLGEKGCVFLVHVLCVTVAARRPRKGFIAGLGLLVYFSSEGFLNLHVLDLPLAFFNRRLEFPLTLTIILFSFVACLFLLYLAARIQKSQPAAQQASAKRSDVVGLSQDLAMSPEQEELIQSFIASSERDYTEREVEVLSYVFKRTSTEEMARAMYIQKTSVQNIITRLLDKTNTKNRNELINKIRNAGS